MGGEVLGELVKPAGFAPKVPQRGKLYGIRENENGTVTIVRFEWTRAPD